MKTYARVVDGAVVEVILPFSNEQGEEVPIEERFVPEYVAQMVDITGLDPQPLERWTYIEGVFAAPVDPVPTPEEVLYANTQIQSVLLSEASQAMAPVLVSLNLGDATDAETETAKAWQAYYRALQAVDLTSTTPAWPDSPNA